MSWSKPSLAKDYSIDRVNIKNVVSVDGSINVEEERIYNFEGSYSFAYQYINKKGERDEPYGLENFEVCDENKCFEQKNEDINIPETFLVRDERERYYLKWRKERESNPHAISDAGLANLWLTIRRILPKLDRRL